MKKSNIYIGEVIKQVIAEKQVTKAELARRLGVKPQSVDYLLTRKSIDTDTLYSLSLALDYDFAVLYSIKKEHALATDEESPFKVGNAKISLEIELRPDEMLKLNLKQKRKRVVFCKQPLPHLLALPRKRKNMFLRGKLSN